MKHKSFIFAAVVALASAAFAQEGKPSSGGNYEISGKLINANNGETIHKARITIAPVTERGQTQQYDVGSDGAFIFHGLAPGKYSLSSAQARGFAPQSFEQHEGFSTAIAVGPDKTSTGIVFRMRPECSISGHILDEHNEPVRDAQVILFARTTDVGKRTVQRRRQAPTDDQGEYHFRHLSLGTYYIAVSAQPWYRRYMETGYRNAGSAQPASAVDPALDVAYPVTYYPGATDSDSAGALIMRAGDSISADVSLVPVPSMHVTIRNTAGENGRSIQPTFQERVFGDTNIFVPVTTTPSQGEMEVSGIAPGEYSVDMMRIPQFNRNFRAPKRPESQVQQLSLRGDVELDALSSDSVETIHGQIKFDGARPPRNAVIQLRDATSGEFVAGRIDEQGTFTIQPQHSGRYIVALGNAPGYAIRTISGNNGHVSGRAIDFSDGHALELMIAASEGVGTINGTVMKGDQPVSGTMVVLVPQDIADNTSLFRRDQSDSDGTFTLHDVVPGHYTAIAVQNGWDMEWASPEALRPYLAGGTAVQVDGKQQLEIKITPQ